MAVLPHHAREWMGLEQDVAHVADEYLVIAFAELPQVADEQLEPVGMDRPVQTPNEPHATRLYSLSTQIGCKAAIGEADQHHDRSRVAGLPQRRDEDANLRDTHADRSAEDKAAGIRLRVVSSQACSPQRLAASPPASDWSRFVSKEWCCPKPVVPNRLGP